ncbi:MAG: PA0069 family radical SAM protein [Thiotrichales bacterium]|nr:PA0069 family radical SAM protein [Thiotrichales bacterium]
MTPPRGTSIHRGRGALSNASGRFEPLAREEFDDGWGNGQERGQEHGQERDMEHDRDNSRAEAHDNRGEQEWDPDDIPPPKLRTTLIPDATRRIIAWNDSPDLPFDRSVNPYRGCEHGCIYCYARPSHAYLGYSPGLDFETRLVFKPDAAARLRAELGKPGYACAPIALGSNTDPYQPVERDLGITRAVLEVLAECGHPVMIVTKSARVERDLDILGAMAKANRCSVAVSVTTLDRSLARRMEPRASAPHRRLETIRRLAGAGIPTGVMAAPMIPFVNDAELESILEHARAAGALGASYTMLRLPLEIADLFREWLAEHYPDRAGRVMERVRDMRGGKDYDSTFGRRMRGTGPVAELIAKRFRLAVQRLEFPGFPALDPSGFTPPLPETGQLSLL